MPLLTLKSIFIYIMTTDQRLKTLNGTTLEERRKRGDMIEVFKLLHGFDIVPPNTFALMHNMIWATRVIFPKSSVLPRQLSWKHESLSQYKVRCNDKLRKEDHYDIGLFIGLYIGLFEEIW